MGPPFLNSVLDGGQWCSPMLLYSQGNTLTHLLYKWLGGPKNQSECCGEDKNLSPLPGIKPRLLNHPVQNLVTISTELSWFIIYY
jgi:hypothetical protein